MPTALKKIMPTVLALACMSGCADKDLANEMRALAQEPVSIADSQKSWSESNPFGDPTGTSSEPYVVDRFQEYKSIARSVSATPNIPLKPGVYVGLSGPAVTEAYWKNGVPHEAKLILKLTSAGSFEYYEDLTVTDGRDKGKRTLSMAMGTYAIKGFTIKLRNIKGHATSLPPENTLVINRLNTAEQRSEYPNVGIDWTGVDEMDLRFELLRQDLGLTEFWYSSSVEGNSSVATILQMKMSDQDLREKLIATTAPLSL